MWCTFTIPSIESVWQKKWHTNEWGEPLGLRLGDQISSHPGPKPESRWIFDWQFFSSSLIELSIIERRCENLECSARAIIAHGSEPLEQKTNEHN